MRKVFLSLCVVSAVIFFGCGNSNEKKQDDGAVPQDTSKGVSAMKNDSAVLAYVCPCGGCPEVHEKNPGSCPKCGMEMVQEKKK